MCLFWAEPRIGAIFPLPAVLIVEADAEGDLPSAKAPSAKAPGRLHQTVGPADPH